jgi:hypothetical protein
MPQPVNTSERFSPFPQFGYMTPPSQEEKVEREQKQEKEQDQVVQQSDQPVRYTPQAEPTRPGLQPDESRLEPPEQEDTSRRIATEGYREEMDREERIRMDRYA